MACYWLLVDHTLVLAIETKKTPCWIFRRILISQFNWCSHRITNWMCNDSIGYEGVEGQQKSESKSQKNESKSLGG
jgi:hypothetical protein